MPVIGDPLMDANAMFKLENVLSGIDAYHIPNETRQLFATQGWNAVAGGKGAPLQVASGLGRGRAGRGPGALARRAPCQPQATVGVKAGAGFLAGTGLRVTARRRGVRSWVA